MRNWMASNWPVICWLIGMSYVVIMTIVDNVH